jgi:hypothetical protein
VFFFVFSIIKAELWWMHEVNPVYCRAELCWMHEVNPVSKSGALLDVAKQNPLSFHKIKSSDFTQSFFVLRR